MVISASVGSLSFFIASGYSFSIFLFSWVTLLGHKDWKFPSGSLGMKNKNRSWMFFPLGTNTSIQTCFHRNAKDPHKIIIRNIVLSLLYYSFCMKWPVNGILHPVGRYSDLKIHPQDWNGAMALWLINSIDTYYVPNDSLFSIHFH